MQRETRHKRANRSTGRLQAADEGSASFLCCGLKLLRAGKHHNQPLQEAWKESEDFDVVAVEVVLCPVLLPSFKQLYIERAGEKCFNRKSSVPTCRPRWA